MSCGRNNLTKEKIFYYCSHSHKNVLFNYLKPRNLHSRRRMGRTEYILVIYTAESEME